MDQGLTTKDTLVTYVTMWEDTESSEVIAVGYFSAGPALMFDHYKV